MAFKFITSRRICTKYGIQGELQSLQGDTDDHRTVYKSSLQRNPKEYDAVLNGKNLTLPHDAFPTSVWHFEITQKSLLFDLKDLRLMKVKVSKSEDSVSLVGPIDSC